MVILLAPLLAAVLGKALGPGILHPENLNPNRSAEVDAMLERTGAGKVDFNVKAMDGAILRGWKVSPPEPNGDWVLLYHGIADNRSGMLGHAEFLLRHGYSVVMMDARAHGASGGNMCTYGWLERYDTNAITDALYASEKVRHLYALGVSLGAAVALQSAAVDPRIDAVAAEDPFSNMREEMYDYAGLELSPWLGKTLFRPAVAMAARELERDGGFKPEDVSPEKAVAARAFPVLLICGTADRRIPCRHAERIYKAARGPKELWMAPGAGHAAALGQYPIAYENRVVRFFGEYPARR